MPSRYTGSVRICDLNQNAGHSSPTLDNPKCTCRRNRFLHAIPGTDGDTGFSNNGTIEQGSQPNNKYISVQGLTVSSSVVEKL